MTRRWYLWATLFPIANSLSTSQESRFKIDLNGKWDFDQTHTSVGWIILTIAVFFILFHSNKIFDSWKKYFQWSWSCLFQQWHSLSGHSRVLTHFPSGILHFLLMKESTILFQGWLFRRRPINCFTPRRQFPVWAFRHIPGGTKLCMVLHEQVMQLYSLNRLLLQIRGTKHFFLMLQMQFPMRQGQNIMNFREEARPVFTRDLLSGRRI